MIEFAVSKGFVETLTKRRRYLKDIKSKNFILRSAGERAAINTPIQGSAADIIKIAMIHIHNDLKLNKYCRLIMQVHDELIFEVDKNKVSLVVKKIKEHMEKAVQLKVPLSVDIGEGSSWSEAH
jgi:DNA polymerase-1